MNEPRALYNEIDPFAAAWLRELIAAGSLPAGDVDERDIRDLLPSDLEGYTACHFFAGIGGWAVALDMAGWPADRPVWTGSCPCQPFSAAGRGGGFADERHLWPAFFHLISECRPATVFGEQVASAAGLGWLDLVHADMEGAGYAVGAADLPAAGVGAPHLRQRLWWVAHAQSSGGTLQQEGADAGWPLVRAGAGAGGRIGERLRSEGIGRRDSDGSESRVGPLADTDSVYAQGCERGGADAGERQVPRHGPAGLCGGDDGVADADGRHASAEGLQRGGKQRQQPQDGVSQPWRDVEWLHCRDGKARPTRAAQRGLQSVADGLWPSMVGSGSEHLAPLTKGQANRVGMLRGAGNAIVPQVAAEFIRASIA